MGRTTAKAISFQTWARALIGGEVGNSKQTLFCHDKSDNIMSNLPDEIIQAQRATDMSLAALNRMLMECTSLPFPPARVTTEDRLRVAMIEACEWLRRGAPGCALTTLEGVLKRDEQP